MLLFLFSALLPLILSQSSSQQPSLHFFVIGDIGGFGVPGFTTTHTQKRVAKALSARARGADAILNVGDNFYFTGVLTDEDPRFKTIFEDVYRDVNLPWYTIAGNHDHFGSIQAQIDYSKKNSYWRYPSSYYKQSFVGNDGATVDILMLDTVQLCGKTADIDSGSFWEFIGKSVIGQTGKQPQNPSDPIKAEQQWTWIEKELRESNASYVFVAGHYPIHSISSHGPTFCLRERLDPLIRRYNVTAYLAGHDHTLQHIVVNDMHYIVSGAGSRSDSSQKNRGTIGSHQLKFRFPQDKLGIISTIISQTGFSKGGFVDLRVWRDRADLLFVDDGGSVKYTLTLYPMDVVNPTTGQGAEIELL